MLQTQQSQQNTKNLPFIQECNPGEVLHCLNESALRVAAWLSYQFQSNDSVVYTHGQIAERTFSSSSTIKRALNVLRDIGFCSWDTFKINDRLNAPNTYYLSSDFRRIEVQDMLSVFLKNMYKLPLFSLFSKPRSESSFPEVDLPLIIKRKYGIIVDSLSRDFPRSFRSLKSSEHRHEYQDPLAWSSDPSHESISASGVAKQGPCQPETRTIDFSNEINKQLTFAEFDTMLSSIGQSITVHFGGTPLRSLEI